MQDYYKKLFTGALVFFFFILIFKNIEERQKKHLRNKILESKVESVCQIYNFYSNRSFDRYYYIFYYKGEAYYDSQNIYDGDREKSIGRFYKIIFSSKDRELTEIFLDEEVYDTIEIRKAGF